MQEDNNNMIRPDYDSMSDAEKNAAVREMMDNTQIVNPQLQKDYSLFSCVRLTDNMSFYALYSSERNKWFVFDKISLMVVDYTDTDYFKFVFSTPDDGPEWKVIYECNDTDDYFDTPDTQEITAELKKRIFEFDEEEWRSMRDFADSSTTDSSVRDELMDSLLESAPVYKDAESVQNYRYENFVLNKFKKMYLNKIIRIETGERVRFVKVVDFNIDYKKNGFSRLTVSGQTIDIDSGERYFKCKFSDYTVAEKTNVVHFIGYLDELMLLKAHKKDFKKFSVLTEEDVLSLFDDVKRRITMKFNRFMVELEEKRELFKETIDEL